MKFEEVSTRHPSTDPLPQETSSSITKLVGQIYEAAPPAEKSLLIEQLLRPLGILSLVAIANGIFANILFRSGWQNTHIRPEDLQNVQTSDVMALVDYVQQASVGAVDSLARAISSSPAFAGSAAAALLVTLLVRRTRSRRYNQYDPEDNEGYAG
jgi:hypothetical protein